MGNTRVLQTSNRDTKELRSPEKSTVHVLKTISSSITMLESPVILVWALSGPTDGCGLYLLVDLVPLLSSSLRDTNDVQMRTDRVRVRVIGGTTLSILSILLSTSIIQGYDRGRKSRF